MESDSYFVKAKSALIQVSANQRLDLSDPFCGCTQYSYEDLGSKIQRNGVGTRVDPQNEMYFVI